MILKRELLSASGPGENRARLRPPSIALWPCNDLCDPSLLAVDLICAFGHKALKPVSPWAAPLQMPTSAHLHVSFWREAEDDLRPGEEVELGPERPLTTDPFWSGE